MISRRSRGDLLIAALFLCGLMIMDVAALAADAPGRFRINSLKLRGQITNLVVKDINRDGLKDLLVIHTVLGPKKPERWVTVLWQDQASGFDLKRSFSLQPASEVAVIDVGQVDGKEGLDLVCLCQSGVKHYPNQGFGFGRLTPLINQKSAAALPSASVTTYLDFVRDFNGDSRDDLLLFQFGQALLYLGTGKGLDLSQPLPLAIKPRAEMIYLTGIHGDVADQQDAVGGTYFFPRVYPRDWDGDGRKDLIVVGGKDVHVFLQAPVGTYPTQSDRNFEVQLFKPAEDPNTLNSLYPSAPPSLSFADIDHDGKMDVVAQQMIGLLGKMKSKVQLYWGRTGSLAAAKPDREFITKDIAIMALIADVNHDGLLDLVIPTLGLNFVSVGRVLVSGTFPVKLNYYLQSPLHSFPDLPSYIRTVNLIFDLAKFRLAAGIPGIFGDLNGDGLPDEVIAKSKTQLEVIINDAAGKNTNLRETVSVPMSGIPVVDDLNGDKKSDIILNYLDDPDHLGELRVLLNRGNW